MATQKRVGRPAKTLQQHLAEGTFRKDRHEYLLKDSARPDGMLLDEWRSLRRLLLGPDANEEFSGLTRDEHEAYEALIADQDPDVQLHLRLRGTEDKRVDISLGMLNPMYLPPERFDSGDADGPA
jgi:hypothetical protein